MKKYQVVKTTTFMAWITSNQNEIQGGFKMSKCKEKYGKEWSESINESTRDYFEDMPFGTVKHILDKGSRYVLSRGMFYASKHKLQVPESLWNKKVFLFTYIDGYPAQMPRLIKFDIAYDSIEDMIDDGWALD